MFLLNPDTQIVGDALECMVEFLALSPQAGACGASLAYADGGFQHGAFRFPNLVQVALDFFPLAGLPAAHRLHDSRLTGATAPSYGKEKPLSGSTSCWAQP